MRFAIIGLTFVLAASSGAYWYLEVYQNGLNDFGPATASDSAADVGFEWFLSAGELSLGNEGIRAPKGINVILKVDSDSADQIEIEGLNVIAPVAADAVTPIRFFAYKLGHYKIRLASTGASLGTLEIYEGA